ncbi:class I SAM-dependent methyltransferase [Aminipila luticellarii]|uniref:Methyltransferase domain-containing protein n=1 Tax=Aminipila luticellarii TaxID=2507160 RepID=A0A410PSQ3_9FIRM|nr:class I SAM-dependent methyltransferase [Aminipila luticellarii]QAT41916.1 methyltransferase domain-containing protein [Aminipila luticellarii]
MSFKSLKMRLLPPSSKSFHTRMDELEAQNQLSNSSITQLDELIRNSVSEIKDQLPVIIQLANDEKISFSESELKIEPLDPPQQVIEEAPFLGYEAIKLLLQEYQFESVLDIGCGEGLQSDYFLSHGKKVTAINNLDNDYFHKETRIDAIIDDFNNHTFSEQFDCIWCSHCLEHQRNPGHFLDKIFSALKENGVLAITVPHAETTICPGHVSYWDAGRLIHHLLLAGFNCRDIRIKAYGYNLSVVLEKHSIDVSSELNCWGDLDFRRVKRLFPEDVIKYVDHYNEWGSFIFYGDIIEMNWENPENDFN